MNWNRFLDLIFKYKYVLLNTTASGLTLLTLLLINKKLKKKFPKNYSGMVKYISALNVLIAIATSYSIYRFNASKLLEEHLYFLLGLITKKLKNKKEQEQKQQVKTFKDMQNYNMLLRMEENVIQLQVQLGEEISLWNKRKDELALLPESLDKMEISNNFEKRIGTMKKRLKKLKELQKVYREQMPNTFGINIYWLIGAFTILLSIKNPNIKIIELMEKILSYFNGPGGDPYTN